MNEPTVRGQIEFIGFFSEYQLDELESLIDQQKRQAQIAVLEEVADKFLRRDYVTVAALEEAVNTKIAELNAEGGTDE